MKKLLEKLSIKAVNDSCHIAGHKTLKGNGELITSYSPIDGHPIAQVTLASSKDYQQTIDFAFKQQDIWKQTPAPLRGAFIRDVGNILRDYKEPLGEMISLEMGKIKAEGMGEVQEMIDICDFAVGLSRQLYGLNISSERFQHRMMEQWHPLGCIGVISAFNFPLAVWAWNVALAVVCGNICVWKPSELTPLVAIAVHQLVHQVALAYKAVGVLNLVCGQADIGKMMSVDKRLSLISFTGSCQTGKQVSKTVADRFGKVLLELGGNNALIVTQHADMDLALRAVLFGAVGTAGQRCTSTRRLILHQSIKEEFIKKLKSAYAQVNIGNSLDSNTLMGPLINKQAVENMALVIQEAIESGGKLIYGGKLREDLGPFYVQPTIIDMPGQNEIVKKETFAPILYILTYEHFHQAIQLNNAVDQGLSSAIFTENLKESECFLSAMGSDCGIANVNIGTSGAEIGGAFGGEKATGGGRESGSDAWKNYMRRQTNTINFSDSLPLAQGIKFNQ